MGEFILGLAMGGVIATLVSSFMYYVVFPKDKNEINNHLPETKANVPMPEVKPCETSLDDEILRILDKHNKEILGVVKEEITKKFNDRPSDYNHRQRIELYNDVMKIIGNHICGIDKGI